VNGKASATTASAAAALSCRFSIATTSFSLGRRQPNHHYLGYLIAALLFIIVLFELGRGAP
jgi:hypothetical protein